MEPFRDVRLTDIPRILPKVKEPYLNLVETGPSKNGSHLALRESQFVSESHVMTA